MWTEHTLPYGRARYLVEKGYGVMAKSKPQYSRPQMVPLGENAQMYAWGQTTPCATGTSPADGLGNVCLSGFTAGGPVPVNCAPGAQILGPRVCLPLGGQR